MPDIEVKSESKTHYFYYFTKWVKLDVKELESFYSRGRKTGSFHGFLNVRLVRIVSGTCEVRTSDGDVFHLKEGDLWFIPRRMTYTSRWRGNEDIVYEVLELDADMISHYYKTMQVLRIPEAEPLFGKLMDAQKQGRSYAALAAVCMLMDAVLPHLKRTENQHLERVLPALRFMDEHYLEEIEMSSLAKLCHLCPARFYNVFRQAVNVTPLEYKNRLKLTRAVILVQKGKTNEEICEILNYSSPSYLRRMMKKYLGLTPKDVKKGMEM